MALSNCAAVCSASGIDRGFKCPLPSYRTFWGGKGRRGVAASHEERICIQLRQSRELPPSSLTSYHLQSKSKKFELGTVPFAFPSAVKDGVKLKPPARRQGARGSIARLVHHYAECRRVIHDRDKETSASGGCGAGMDERLEGSHFKV